MKIRSAFLTEMSGKLGGAVGSTARGGIQYLRKLVIPSNPRTLLQTAIRAGVASVSSLWLTLDEAAIQSWWDLATGSATGKSIFSKLNQPRVYVANAGRAKSIAGATLNPTPPYFLATPEATLNGHEGTTVEFIPPQLPVIDDSANTLALGTIPADVPLTVDCDADNNAVVYVYVSAAQSATRLSRQHPYQLAQAYVLITDGANALTAINLAALSLPTLEGRVMYVKVYGQDAAGRLSIPQEYRVTIVA